MPEWGPEIVEFLEKLVISVDVHNEMLACWRQTMRKLISSFALLKEYPDLWAEWLPAEIADNIKKRCSRRIHPANMLTF